MDSLAVVGDVHGDVRRLAQMLDRLRAYRGHVVFVGDYVDGGSDSAEVIEMLASLSVRHGDRFTFLCGNHELALLRYIDDGDLSHLSGTGGIATLASYLPVVTGDVHAAFLRALPEKHLAFLRALESCWETEECLVSHAGFDPARPAARDVATLACAGGWPIFDATSFPRDLVVCGHYIQRRGPYSSAQLICVDTGCGLLPDGRLSAVLLPERQFLTV